MKIEQQYNLKNNLIALSMILSVLGVRLVDQYVYDMNMWIGIILVILLSTSLYKIIDSSSKFDKEITKRTRTILNIFSLAVIFFLFYTFNL